MNVITVGNPNAQEGVLAINVLMSFDSAEEHRFLLVTQLVTQLSLKLTYLQCTSAPNFMA